MTRHLTQPDAPLDLGEWDDADDILDPDELDGLDPFAEDVAEVKAEYRAWRASNPVREGKHTCGNCGRSNGYSPDRCSGCYQYAKRNGCERPV